MRAFMAIRALLGQTCSFIPDLESFSGVSSEYAFTTPGRARIELQLLQICHQLHRVPRSSSILHQHQPHCIPISVLHHLHSIPSFILHQRYAGGLCNTLRPCWLRLVWS
jgi:hypothetical protein